MSLQNIIKKVLKEEKETEKGWKTLNGQLSKKFEFSDYDETIDFVNKVAKIAKKHNHHPDMKIGYDVVVVSIFDHEANKISDKCHKFVNALNKIS